MENTIKRVYPIRTTRNKWKIPIISTHQCDINCKTIFKKDTHNPNIFYLVENQSYINGRCEKFGKLEHTCVQLSLCDQEDSEDYIKNLYNIDEIVIPDNEINIFLNFPLTNPAKINTKSSSDNGFTLKDLIFLIKNIYKHIYDIEEMTSTPRIYNYKKICEKCMFVDINKLLVKHDKDVFDCCICFSNKSKEGTMLPCKHIFHSKCINKWIEKSLTCPLCRLYINNCKLCNGVGLISCSYQGVVIPRNERGIYMNRPTTDGEFGIYCYDFEDLYIDYMYYEKINKKLTIKLKNDYNYMYI